MVLMLPALPGHYLFLFLLLQWTPSPDLFSHPITPTHLAAVVAVAAVAAVEVVAAVAATATAEVANTIETLLAKYPR
jgi:hypothetical protein